MGVCLGSGGGYTPVVGKILILPSFWKADFQKSILVKKSANPKVFENFAPGGANNNLKTVKFWEKFCEIAPFYSIFALVLGTPKSRSGWEWMFPRGAGIDRDHGPGPGGTGTTFFWSRSRWKIDRDHLKWKFGVSKMTFLLKFSTSTKIFSGAFGFRRQRCQIYFWASKNCLLPRYVKF